MNLLPLIPRFNSTFSNERYLGCHSFENVNCKYSNYDKLNDISRLSNGSYQLNNCDKYEDTQKSRYYEGVLMQVVNESNNYNEAERLFNVSTKDSREFNSTVFLNNTKNNVNSNTKPLRKRNYDASPDELNIKSSHRDELSNKYNEIFDKESCGSSAEAKNADIIDEDDLTDYFIGTEKMRSKSYAELVNLETCLPTKLFDENTRIEQESLSYMYDVFDYGHKSVDVEKLPIVDPNFNAKSNKEYCSIQSDLLQLCSETSKPLTYKDDSVVSGNKVVVPATLPGLINFSSGVQNVGKQWKLIRIDCPLRVQVSGSDVNLKNCSARDPRLSHLRS